jgi:hypothetical protein
LKTAGTAITGMTRIAIQEQLEGKVGEWNKLETSNTRIFATTFKSNREVTGNFSMRKTSCPIMTRTNTTQPELLTLRARQALPPSPPQKLQQPLPAATYPLSNAAIQTQRQSEHDREIPEVDLMSPAYPPRRYFPQPDRNMPMCMYSAHGGFANDFHLVHLGSRSIGGVGLVVVEATAVTAEGRIPPGDMGIWKDEHIEPLARIARFVEMQDAIP